MIIVAVAEKVHLFDEYHILVITKQNPKSYHTSNVHLSTTFLPSTILQLKQIMALEERGEQTYQNSISALQRKDIHNLNAVLNAANFSPKSVQTCFEARN
jgi:hypothetical protein